MIRPCLPALFLMATAASPALACERAPPVARPDADARTPDRGRCITEADVARMREKYGVTPEPDEPDPSRPKGSGVPSWLTMPAVGFGAGM